MKWTNTELSTMRAMVVAGAPSPAIAAAIGRTQQAVETKIKRQMPGGTGRRPPGLPPIDLEARFHELVPVGAPDECWEWQGQRKDLYGRLETRGVNHRAHRLAWSFANRRGIPDGLIVRHRCDNPPCCNPAHLELGTYADNARDREIRGRHGRRAA